jgi:hypothetical protein
MGRIRPPQRVKLLIGLICDDADLMHRTEQLLCRQFGGIDLTSEDYPFDQTEYYRDELGADLLRRFVSFERLIQPDHLADIKRATNALEDDIARDTAADEGRTINIDPGYIALGKLVLASTKDHSHRIYLQSGIFAEVTLQYRDKAWAAGPATFPDFAMPRYHPFLNLVRQRLRKQLD